MKHAQSDVMLQPVPQNLQAIVQQAKPLLPQASAPVIGPSAVDLGIAVMCLYLLIKQAVRKNA